MGYVPGQKWDLFLSYAHNDKEWVDAFRKQLSQGLLERLGMPAALWQDTREIQLGMKWPDEISSAIREAAAFLTICSPSYYRSTWCKREREAVLADGDLEKLRAGQFYRFLKIIKTPSAGVDENFLAELQHIRFFGDTDEYLPASPEFGMTLRRTVAALAELLRTMRNSRQALYIAATSDSLEDDYNQLCTQLKDYGYNVRPETKLGPEFEDKLLKQELESSTASVFLLGADHHPYLEHQIGIARTMKPPMIFWPHPDALKTPDQKQEALIESLRTATDLPPGSQMMGGASIRDLIRDLLELLRPKPAVAAPESNGGPKVYLLYDTTAAEDTAFANRLGDIIRERKMTVFVPDPGAGAASDRLPRHESLMRACNGVLLYRGQSAKPDNWLFQTLPDVLWAENKFSRDKLKAKTFLLADPAPLAGIGGVDLIPFGHDFSPQTLQPFFTQMEKQ